MAAIKGSKLIDRAKFTGIGLILGVVLGVVGTTFVQNHNPKDERPVTASVVFERIVKKSELVCASQCYSITEKTTDTDRFFDLFDIPWTTNSFWYRYNGLLKAGVNLENAEFSQEGETTIKVKLDQPYLISNTPDMSTSGVLEENNNIFNPIHVEDVDAFQRLCIEMSEEQVDEGELMEEARLNAEEDIRDMFTAALGEGYTVKFEWREPADEASEQ